MEGIRLLKKGWSQAEVARHFEVSREAVRQWWERYETGGLRKVKAQPRLGSKPLVDPAVMGVELPKILLAGPRAFGFGTELWTLARVSKAIEGVLGVRYVESQVWNLLRAHGWSWQRPERQARERDERRARRWRLREWPRIKKGLSTATRPSSSPTRVASG